VPKEWDTSHSCHCLQAAGIIELLSEHSPRLMVLEYSHLPLETRPEILALWGRGIYEAS
jgi:hypothetical protein